MQAKGLHTKVHMGHEVMVTVFVQQASFGLMMESTVERERATIRML